MPHWTTTAGKTKEKMVGDRNRPLGLILEWKMMLVFFFKSFIKLFLSLVHSKFPFYVLDIRTPASFSSLHG
jgi:hypothetical protein